MRRSADYTREEEPKMKKKENRLLLIVLRLGLLLLSCGPPGVFSTPEIRPVTVQSPSAASPNWTADGPKSSSSSTPSPQPPFTCPLDCLCKNVEVVDCRGTSLNNVTNFLTNQPVVKLDLSHTEIRKLGPMSFRHLTMLEDLNLAGNTLVNIDIHAFHHSRLKYLSLQSAHISHIPVGLFSHLPNLQTLRLDSNDISQLDPSSMSGLTSLRHLRLDVNQLSSIPREALSRVTTLEVLNLSYNKIKAIPAGAFLNLTSLIVLVLDHNDVEYIDDAAFEGLSSLKILEMRHNQITQIPPGSLRHFPALNELYLSNNNLQHIQAGVLQQASRLTVVELRGNPLVTVDWEAFAFLPRLQKLILSEVKELRQFPSLNGSSAIEMIRIDRAKLRSLPKDLCLFVPHLRSLDVKSNLIEDLPDFTRCRSLRLLDLSHNRINSLPDYTFHHQVHLHDLLLSHNKIKEVPEHAFVGLRKLKILDLSENDIESVHPDTFLPLTEVQDVNLGHNRFPVFPSVGLENALHIKVHNNPYLREFPTPSAFPRVKTLALSYAYHCCPFQQPAFFPSLLNGFAVDDTSLRDSIIFPSNEHDIDLTAWAKGETMWVDSNPLWTNISQQWANLATAAGNHNLSEADLEKFLSSSTPNGGKSAVLLTATRINSDRKNAISCIPEPSPFMPCQDLFDWWSLRCGVWIVFLMALLGNGAVVFVLIFARSKIDVPRFLVCNLGMADFFMGIYLGFLAVVDASTLGEFRMYAIPWQLSAGCQVAGFFGVLSSELSVFTLAVITMERNYAITHAMHLNKRLSLRHASYIMAAGWLFALIMAFLPLVGVSDYRKFAVCLPFEIGNSVSKGYVVFLMVINGVAFLILMGCYLKMYCAIRGSQAWNSNDSRIAKRMALLVFTDFLCWAPIAFFSLTAASGLLFVSLEEAKIFTVFILPLNSCCNPFLYAILTKQFKKDCVMICKAIEESRVTRGIGRCRHSSNFSNRQTPGNTNSLGDRNSSKDGSSCQCGQGRLLKDDKNSSSSSSHHHHHHHHHHRHGPGWLRPLRNFLRRIRAVEREMGESSSSANEYAYQIAEIQQKQQHRNKHRRAESVSSDNYSSSRSDSVKAMGCGLPLRMVGRRRNSWTVTRKPSSDSNLSSSRNDSTSTSAMTASTSAGTTTWRNSRSSVSSDGGSSTKGSIRERISNKGGPPSGAVVPMTHLPVRTTSVRDKNSRLPTSPLAAGILRQQSVATPTGSLVQRTIVAHTTSSASADGIPAANPAAHCNPAVVVVAAPSSGGAKNKPRLMRQSAVLQDENSSGHTKSVSFNPTTMKEEPLRPPHFCPLHAPQLEGVWESSIEEDEDEEDPVEEEGEEEKSQSKMGGFLFQAVASIYTNRDKNRLGLSGFVPRKLSTISSRSCSINPEADEGTSNPDESSRTNPPAASVSSELLQHLADDTPLHGRRMERLASKSDNDLYYHQRATSHLPVMTSMARLPIVQQVPKASAAKQAISGITSSSFEMIDDNIEDEVFQEEEQPGSHQVETRERDGGDGASKEERDPLLFGR